MGPRSATSSKGEGKEFQISIPCPHLADFCIGNLSGRNLVDSRLGRVVNARHMPHEIELDSRKLFRLCLAGKDHGPFHNPLAMGIKNTFYPCPFLPATNLWTEVMEFRQVISCRASSENPGQILS